MAKGRRLKNRELKLEFQKGLRRILAKWPFLQDHVLTNLWENQKLRLKAYIVSFFATNNDPSSKDVAFMLASSGSKPQPLNLLFSSDCEAVGELLTIRGGCVLEEESGLTLTFSMEKFEQDLYVYLSNGSFILDNLADFQSMKTTELHYMGVVDFFFINTDPNEDDMATMLREQISTRLETVVETNDCKQVGQELLTWYQVCLEKDSQMKQKNKIMKKPAKKVKVLPSNL